MPARMILIVLCGLSLAQSASGQMWMPAYGQPLPYQPPEPPAAVDTPERVPHEPVERPHRGCVGGFTAYALYPFFENNVAYVTVNEAETVQSSTDFDWSIQPAGAAWIGWAYGNGRGCRARYFHFEADSRDLTIATSGLDTITSPPSLTVPGGFAFGAPGVLVDGTDNLSFVSELAVNVADIEMTYEWFSGPFAFLISGGARAMRLQQEYHATLFNNTDPIGDTESQALDFENEFLGGGPTLAILGRWNFGEMGCYGMARGALLVGQGERRTTFSQIVNDVNGVVTQNVFVQNTSTSTQVLPVCELELGLEYGYEAGRSRYLVRTAVVNQTYFNAGNASDIAGSMSLFGVQLSVGVNY